MKNNPVHLLEPMVREAGSEQARSGQSVESASSRRRPTR